MALFLVWTCQEYSAAFYIQYISAAVTQVYALCFIIQFHSYKNVGIAWVLWIFIGVCVRAFGGLKVVLVTRSKFAQLIQNKGKTGKFYNGVKLFEVA